MKILAIIPARSGSKGITNKNMTRINGRTLIARCLDALPHELVKKVVISTDSSQYIEHAEQIGIESFGIRDAKHSTDKSNSFTIILDLLEKGISLVDYSHILLLQPTFPFRTRDDLNEFLSSFDSNEFDSSVTVSKVSDPHPHKMKVIGTDGGLVSFLSDTTSEISRQFLPQLYFPNGAFYLSETQSLINEQRFLCGKVQPFIMDARVNIDESEDLQYAQFYNHEYWVEI